MSAPRQRQARSAPAPTTRARSCYLRPLTTPSQPVDCTTLVLLNVDRKFDQVHSNLFSCLDSIFAICFSIQNLDMSGDEISRLILVILYGDNFARWSQAMRSYLKGHKLWLYVFNDRPIPEKVNKETDSAYAIRIEDWESANHHIITWFRNTSIPSIVDEFGNLYIAKEVWDLLVTIDAGPSSA